MAKDEKYQGIIVHERFWGLSNSFVATYLQSSKESRQSFDKIVESGIYQDQANLGDSTLVDVDVLDSKWLDEPTDWKTITSIGSKMEDSASQR